MWRFFKRLFGIVDAKAHKALDAIEDPIEKLEAKVRELENGHKTAVNGLAKAKAVEVKYRKKAVEFEERADKYRENADKLKSRYDAAKKADQAQLKEDIILMLNKEENMREEAKAEIVKADNQETVVSNLETKIKNVTNLIKTTKGNITNLKAQRDAAEVNKNISKELSSVNFDGVAAQIEGIEQAILEDNAEAEAWDHIDTALEDDEARIEKMLKESSSTEDSKLFDDFMSK